MDIRALAEKGYDIAQGLADQAWQTVTLRLNPERSGYDPVTETSTINWETEIQVSALKYSEREFTADTSRSSQMSKATSGSVINEVFLIKSADTGYLDSDTRAEIQLGNVKYGITAVETDPVGATNKFIVAR